MTAPTPEEIEAVGDALITLTHTEYSEEQLDEMNHFLKSYTEDYAKESITTLFEKEDKCLEALETLHIFVEKYHSHGEIYHELKMEMDEVAFYINEEPGSIFL
ncbi:hypothetical protein CC99x_007640 [Candidatus Berkiella cookevillensis]|uniref:Uncharacterized protein n=1 Tax=Candidatus Berkiella cookevillensis TaxID=437022 RepID=A0A0Q9YI63_9GAMM|nr:hypothetical protein [Candidatus Berkiella cookevillensis]MCS5708775.1 hypothetical protein [Candidatus Berkiella cookevillensis]